MRVHNCLFFHPIYSLERKPQIRTNNKFQEIFLLTPSQVFFLTGKYITQTIK